MQGQAVADGLHHNLDPSTCGQSVLLPPLLIPVIEGIVQGHLTLACINQLYMY